MTLTMTQTMTIAVVTVTLKLTMTMMVALALTLPLNLALTLLDHDHDGGPGPDPNPKANPDPKLAPQCLNHVEQVNCCSWHDSIKFTHLTGRGTTLIIQQQKVPICHAQAEVRRWYTHAYMQFTCQAAHMTS